MRNPFRRKATQGSERPHHLIMELVVDVEPVGPQPVTITVDYTEPSAALAALYKVGRGHILHALAAEIGTHTCKHTADGKAAE